MLNGICGPMTPREAFGDARCVYGITTNITSASVDVHKIQGKPLKVHDKVNDTGGGGGARRMEKEAPAMPLQVGLASSGNLAGGCQERALFSRKSQTSKNLYEISDF